MYAVSAKSNYFDKLTRKKCPYHNKGIFEDLEFSNIFPKVQHPYVEFDWKQDGDVSEPVRPTVLELCPNSLIKNDQILSKAYLVFEKILL